MDQPRDPSLDSVLELQREIIVDGIYVMLPGTIVSYDATTQQAVVQVSIRNRHLAEDGETQVVEDYPPIHNVPVEFCGPARGRITWPVAANDPCEVRFASSSLSKWIKLGGTGVDPGDDRRSDISDAICFVGLHSPAQPPTDAPTNALVLHVDGTSTIIQLGSSAASSKVVVESALGDFMSALTTAIGTAPSSGTAALTALQTALNNLHSGGGWKANTSKVVAE